MTTTATQSTSKIPNLGVDWHLPDGKGGFRKRRFASTTPASSLLIAMLAGDGLTWSEIAEEIRYDPEAVAVARRFVEEGHGDVKAAEMVR